VGSVGSATISKTPHALPDGLILFFNTLPMGIRLSVAILKQGKL
jgi:hypothetical protein